MARYTLAELEAICAAEERAMERFEARRVAKLQAECLARAADTSPARLALYDEWDAQHERITDHDIYVKERD